MIYVPTKADEVVRETNQRLDRMAAGLPGVSTGFSFIDKLTGGFQKRTLTLLAAPRQEHADLALNMAVNAATKSKAKTVYISLGRNKPNVAVDVQGILSGIARDQLRNSQLSTEEKRNRDVAAQILVDAPLYIESAVNATVFDLELQFTQDFENPCLDKPDLVVIDDLHGIVQDDDLPPERIQAIEHFRLDVVMTLKGMAEKYQAAVLLLAKAREPASGHSVCCQDVPFIRQFEPFLDVVMLLTMPYANMTPKPRLIEPLPRLVVGLNKLGCTGFSAIGHSEETGRFIEIEQGYQ